MESTGRASSKASPNLCAEDTAEYKNGWEQQNQSDTRDGGASRTSRSIGSIHMSIRTKQVYDPEVARITQGFRTRLTIWDISYAYGKASAPMDVSCSYGKATDRYPSTIEAMRGMTPDDII